MATWIKICATTGVEDALASIEAGANALGFVFAPSKRRISAEQARQIIAAVPRGVERIGVFAYEAADRVAGIVERVGLTGVQLHGGETAAYISDLRNRLPQQSRITLIKAILVSDGFETRFAQVRTQYEGIDYILLDSGGGTGRTFDWRTVQPLVRSERGRLIVAGGLHAGNVGEAIQKFSPWGVDVASGVEFEPGRKDPDKLKAFVAAVRKAERS